MSATAPLVSVIIPTYNRMALLPTAVESVLRQSCDDLELIVVDDGSDDRTPNFLADLEDARVKVIRRAARSSAAAARNAGIAKASGHHVAFLDSDDWWLPTKLVRQLDRLRAQPPCRWCYTMFGIADAEGRDLPVLAGGPWLPHEGRVTERIITGEVLAPIPTLMIERALLEEVGGFDDALLFGEDLDLRLRLAERSPVGAVPEQLVKIREHDDRSTFHRQDIHLWWVRVLDGFRRRTADPRLRRLCRRQSAEHLAYFADDLAQRGELRGAVRHLRRALAYWPLAPGVWEMALKTVARPIAPASARRLYRRIRGAAGPRV